MAKGERFERTFLSDNETADHSGTQWQWHRIGCSKEMMAERADRMVDGVGCGEMHWHSVVRPLAEQLWPQLRLRDWPWLACRVDQFRFVTIHRTAPLSTPLHFPLPHARVSAVRHRDARAAAAEWLRQRVRPLLCLPALVFVRWSRVVLTSHLAAVLARSQRPFDPLPPPLLVSSPDSPTRRSSAAPFFPRRHVQPRPLRHQATMPGRIRRR
jgi:hypothetical protein